MNFPALRNSGVEFSAVDSLHRFVSNEGTEFACRKRRDGRDPRLRAGADGMIVRDLPRSTRATSPRMFPEDELMKSARAHGRAGIENRRRAPRR